MMRKGFDYVVDSKKYVLVGNQCDNVACSIMSAGEKEYYVSNTPNWSFEGVAEDWGLSIEEIGG